MNDEGHVQDPAGDAEALEQKKILLVDDDEDALHGMNLRLRASGYDTAVAVDAVSAISIAKAEQPDLILLDLGLPAGDGYLVLRRLRSIPVLAWVPVIVLSARDPATNRSRALAEGAAAYFQKPADNAELLEAISNYLAA